MSQNLSIAMVKLSTLCILLVIAVIGSKIGLPFPFTDVHWNTVLVVFSLLLAREAIVFFVTLLLTALNKK